MNDITYTGEATVSTFLDALAGKQSTPGGGGAAAITGSQAAALVSMVINFTIGNKKYAGVQETMQELLTQSEKLRHDLLQLADKDVAAFKAVSACYGMPRSTEDEKTARTQAIQAALKEAAMPPYETAQRSMEVVLLVKPVAEMGNTNVVSDAAAAIYLTDAALKSALLNVKINLKFIRDDEFNQEWSAKCDELVLQMEAARQSATQACEQALGIEL